MRVYVAQIFLFITEIVLNIISYEEILVIHSTAHLVNELTYGLKNVASFKVVSFEFFMCFIERRS